MKNIKPFRAVRASIVNEKLKAKKPGDSITIDVDLDYEPGNKYAEKAFKKYKLKVEPNGATEVSHDMTGTKQNIINYLQSPYYEFDDADIRDIYPELLEKVNEASVKKGDYVLYKGNGTQWTKSKVMQVIPSARKLHIDWNDEYIEVDMKNVKPVKEAFDDPAWFEPIAAAALAQLKKHHKWKDMELAAMGPGNKKDYIDMAITHSKKMGPEYEFTVWFDKNDKVTKIKKHDYGHYESVDEGVSADIKNVIKSLKQGKKVFGRHVHPRLSGKEFEILSVSPSGARAMVLWQGEKKPADMVTMNINPGKIRIE